MCLCNYLTTCDQIPTTTVRERERATFFHFPNMGILGLDLSKHNWHLCPPWVCVCARILPNYMIAVSKLPNCFPILPQFEFCLNFNLLQFGFCPNLDFVSIWFLHYFELSDGSVQIARLLSKLPFSSQFASCQCPVASGQSQDCG